MFIIRRQDVYHDKDGIWRYGVSVIEMGMVDKACATEILDVLAVKYDAKAQIAVREIEGMRWDESLRGY